MKSVYGVTTPIADVRLQDYVEVMDGLSRSHWVRVDRIDLLPDGTYMLGLEGSQLFSLDKGQTLRVRYWVD
jgi:hypothetical protein